MAKKKDFEPMKLFTDCFPDVSGNTINGLGESEWRRPSIFFWHPPEKQTHARLQKEVTDYHRRSPEIRATFSPNAPGGRGPKPVERAADKEGHQDLLAPNSLQGHGR